MQLLEFLKFVLPSQGHYCWVTIKDKKARQGFVQTIEALEKKLLEEDAKGIDTYFACASFLEPGSRKSDNVLGAKAFWLDIDAGEGKPYPDAQAASDALDVFCQKSKLPYPTVVCSGNGIHAWWALTETLDPKKWRQYAERLKRFTEVNGMDADPSRTRDIASILRPPGTSNYKRPDRPNSVSVWEFDGEERRAYPLAAFDTARIDVIANWDKIKGETNEKVSLTKGYGEGERTQALTRICGHLLGPANNLDADMCLERVRAWNLLNAPPLDDAKLVSTVASLARSEAKKHETLVGTMGELPKLPYGYKWDARGRMITSVPIKDADGWEEVGITEFPIYLLSVSQKERGIEQAYVFHMWLPKRGWQEFFISSQEFEGPGWSGVMAKNGVDFILNKKLFKNYVTAATIQFRRDTMDAIRYSQFGWKNDNTAFLVGDVLIHDGGKIERVSADDDLMAAMRQTIPHKSGSLANWTADANCLFGDETIHWGYTLVAGFAAVLLTFLMDEYDGGIALSLVSDESGRGKSKMLQAIASIWGGPLAIKIKGNDTENAAMAIITRCCNLPVVLDEWEDKDPQVLRRLIKRFTVGEGKNRAEKNGSVKAEAPRFKTLLTLTSNDSLLDLVRETGDKGATARLIEIEAPELSLAAAKLMSERTGRMLQNCGYAGREFIFQLLQPGVFEHTKTELKKTEERFWEALNTEPKHRYLAWLPAAIWVASGILTRNGILEFSPERITQWGLKETVKRLKEQNTGTPTELISRFINEHIGQCLMVNIPYHGRTPVMVLNNMGNIPYKVIMRSERDTNRLYISVQALRLWMMKLGQSYTSMVKKLEEMHVVLNTNKPVTLGAGTPAMTGRVGCLELNMAHPAMGGGLTDISTLPLPTSGVSSAEQ